MGWRMKRLFVLGLVLAVGLGGLAAEAKQKKQAGGGAIEWGERITLVPPEGGMGRYPRLVKVTKGARAGDLLLCYQTEETGGDFWMYRSSDNGHSWDGPKLVNSATRQWNYASCNVIQLSDGRLMMSMLRRARGSVLGKDFFIDVRFSGDGGESWGAPQQVFQGANWEGRAIEVPHDANGDGTRDIYLFFTQNMVPTTQDAAVAARNEGEGTNRGVAWIASYDGGKSWSDPNPERFTGRIVHRNFDEAPGEAPTERSGGGMPTPFLLPKDRIGFVAEEIGKARSPYVVANDPGDWDWTGAAFQGPWTSADYDGIGDDAVYPQDPDNAWPVTEAEFGGAPYGTVLPDGRIAVAVNTKKRINVWVGDRNGRNFQPQQNPFGGEPSFYAFIEPISPGEVLVGAGPPEAPGGFIYLRRGRIVP